MDEIQIEVAYALPERQHLLAITLPQGNSVEDAIIASGILALCPEIDLQKNKIGIYSRSIPLSHILENGDRVEIYRPLLVDPKELRRQRAERAKK